MMGGSVEHWNNQHIQRHHIETSIIPIDYDTMYPLKRVLSSYKPLWFHKYQHVYMWFLYPVTMLAWTLGDIAYVLHPRVTHVDKAKSLVGEAQTININCVQAKSEFEMCFAINTPKTRALS